MKAVGWLWLVLLVLAGCAKRNEVGSVGYYGAMPTRESEAYPGDGYGYADSAPSPRRSIREDEMAKEAWDAPVAAPSPPPPPPTMALEGSVGGQGEPPSSEIRPTTPAPADRMVHYDGWTRLKVADPRETLESVVAVAESVGGRTERLAGTSVTVRVPVRSFEQAWDRILELGDVMDRSVRADDVTEAYTAIDLRARTLKATQARLVELLSKAREEEEKLRLLQELTRVTEELDALESQLRTLSDLASMSRITVEAVAREAFTSGGGRPELDGFAWIGALSPFQRAVFSDDKRIELPVPEGLVALTPRGPFMAESPDGTVLWTLRVPNDPIGGGAFWSAAVSDRLADEFAAPTPSRLGPWECLSLDEPGTDEPYRWQVCVRSVGRWVEVAQAWYPGPGSVERYGPGIEQSLTEGGGGS